LVDAFLTLVRPDFTAPGVAGERRELRVLDEIERRKTDPWRIAARIPVPAPSLQTPLHHAGTYDDIVATLEIDLLFFRRAVKIGVGDAISVIDRLDALVTLYMEKPAAPATPFLVFF